MVTYICNSKMNVMRRDIFQAIADPTRREIIALLSKKSLNLNAIADNFEISRPAVSKHIKILTECGIIKIRKEGRERYCDAQLKNLQKVSAWADKYKTFWETRLEKLDIHLSKK